MLRKILKRKTSNVLRCVLFCSSILGVCKFSFHFHFNDFFVNLCIERVSICCIICISLSYCIKIQFRFFGKIVFNNCLSISVSSSPRTYLVVRVHFDLNKQNRATILEGSNTFNWYDEIENFLIQQMGCSIPNLAERNLSEKLQQTKTLVDKKYCDEKFLKNIWRLELNLNYNSRQSFIHKTCK